jgi:hypothetical protein
VFRARRNAERLVLRTNRNIQGNSINTKLDGLSISPRGFLTFADVASGVALLVPKILAHDEL